MSMHEDQVARVERRLVEHNLEALADARNFHGAGNMSATFDARVSYEQPLPPTCMRELSGDAYNLACTLNDQLATLADRLGVNVPTPPMDVPGPGVMGTLRATRDLLALAVERLSQNLSNL